MVNNDGLVDIYFTSNQGENKLYINQVNKFEDISINAGVEGQVIGIRGQLWLM
jgi:hypothetical protein